MGSRKKKAAVGLRKEEMEELDLLDIEGKCVQGMQQGKFTHIGDVFITGTIQQHISTPG